MSKTHKKDRKSGNTVARISRMFNPTTDNNRIEKVRLVSSNQISSTGAGIINTTIAMDPSGGGASEWSQYSTIYDEFRVLAIRVSLLPYQQGSVTAKNDLCGIVYDNDDTKTLTSLNAALEYDTAYVIPTVWYANTAKLTKFMWARPRSGTDTAILWHDVANPSSSPGSVKFYSSNLTVSTTYYSYVTEWFCEFRGRR